MPTVVQSSFEGIDFVNPPPLGTQTLLVPPDTDIAVSSSTELEVVNERIQAINKASSTTVSTLDQDLVSFFGESLPGDQALIVATNIMASTEGRTYLVNFWYNTYLRRPGDPGGLTNFVNLLSLGYTDENLIAFFVTSPEYFNYVATH